MDVLVQEGLNSLLKN